jgi:hypothetical protein
MIVLSVIFCLSYWKLPRWGILQAIYHNDALTTAALLLGFVVVDLVVPWSLVLIVCGLSRLRPRVLYFSRKVRLRRR